MLGNVCLDAEETRRTQKQYLQVTCAFTREYRNIIENVCGPGSSVGIPTELQTGLSGIESRWG